MQREPINYLAPIPDAVFSPTEMGAIQAQLNELILNSALIGSTENKLLGLSIAERLGVVVDVEAVEMAELEREDQAGESVDSESEGLPVGDFQEATAA